MLYIYANKRFLIKDEKHDRHGVHNKAVLWQAFFNSKINSA
jgi:hypothetical protein